MEKANNLSSEGWLEREMCCIVFIVLDLHPADLRPEAVEAVVVAEQLLAVLELVGQAGCGRLYSAFLPSLTADTVLPSSHSPSSSVLSLEKDQRDASSWLAVAMAWL